MPGCAGCPMQKLYPGNTFVAPKMPRNGKDLVRLVIAEAPGKDEQKRGEPLVGGAGHIFDKLVEAAGIERDGLTIINCLSCRPRENVFPTDAAARSYIPRADAQASVEQCYKNHVLPVLTSRKWIRVDLLGNKPLRIVAGQTGRISRRRGSPLAISPNLKGIAIYHPAYLMRKPGFFPEAVDDLKRNLD